MNSKQNNKQSTPKQNTPSSPNLPASIKFYLRHLSNSGKSNKTLSEYRRDLLFLWSHQGKLPLEKLSPENLQEFISDIRHNRHAASVNRIKSTVRGLYAYLLATEKIVKDPSRLIRNEKAPRKSPNIFSHEQKEKLLKTIADEIGNPPKFGPMRDWMMFALTYHAGLRVGELVSLNIKDLEGKKFLEVIGKGNKLGAIPLNNKVQLALKKYLPWRKALKAQDHAAVFLNRFGKRITTRAVEKILKNWLKKAGILTRLTPHSFRHTFGTHVLHSSNNNIRVAQKLLRHANVTTTQIYTHVDEEETRSAVENLE